LWASFALEGALVFGILYLLATVNAQYVMAGAGVLPESYIGLTGLVFLGCLIGTRRAIMGEEANLRREVVLLALLSAVLGTLSLLGLLAYFGSSQRLPSLRPSRCGVTSPSASRSWTATVSAS
jgi:hypothetical protein